MDMDALNVPRRKYVCTYCDCSMSFSKPNRLEIHVRTHTGERPFVCDYVGCQRSYVRKMHLDRHVETAHKKVAITFQCTVDGCEKDYATKCGLDKHMKLHLDPDKYRCPEDGCSKAFHKKHHLRAHMFEHSGVLPFQCDVEGCRKQFKQSSHLITHKKTHNPYACDEEGCSEIFDKWSLLRQHKSAMHTAKYQCKVCLKSFPRPVLLNKHLQTHDDAATMFKCPHDDCGRMYTEVKNLRAHIRSYHEGKKLKCFDCGQEFVNKSKLRHHMKVYHENATMSRNKSYPKKGHRRKTVPVKVADHILNTVSPVVDLGIGDMIIKHTDARIEEETNKTPKAKKNSKETSRQPMASFIDDKLEEGSVDLENMFHADVISTADQLKENEDSEMDIDTGSISNSRLHKDSQIENVPMDNREVVLEIDPLDVGYDFNLHPDLAKCPEDIESLLT